MTVASEVMEIESEYRQRLGASEIEFGRSRQVTQRMLVSLLAVLVLAGAVGVKVVYGWVPVWWLLAPAAAIVVIEPIWRRARRSMHRAMRLLDFYDRGVGRVDGTRMQSGETGEVFHEDGHLFERDLNILGRNSIFGMLATTRTAVGQQALAGMLLHPVNATTIRARQEAVRELAPMLELRERVELLGYSAFEQIPSESFARWLGGETGQFRAWMPWALGGMTAAWMLLIAFALVRHNDMTGLLRNVAGLLALQSAFCLWLRPRVVAELDRAQRLAGQTAILRDGLGVLKGMSFSSALLLRLQEEAAGEGPVLRSLARNLMLVEQRAKEWYYLPSTLLGVGSHAAMALDAWRTRHRDEMRRWVACWAELEALLAVSTYAAEHGDNLYPEIVEGQARFVAEGLAHPLLPRDVAVRNDLCLDGETRFLLISGSNMAGKSTLLRAIGCNVVLAMTGAPVCARALTMTDLLVGASLALVDSLAEGKSKFLAEVERLRDLVALAKESRLNGSEGGGSLFLIDEIFSGTNSADRRAAGEAVLRALVAEGSVGALSTHDLALAELAEMPELGGLNVHMASADEGDPLGFDYLLKAGANRTTNAMAIVRLLGL